MKPGYIKQKAGYAWSLLFTERKLFIADVPVSFSLKLI